MALYILLVLRLVQQLVYRRGPLLVTIVPSGYFARLTIKVIK